MSTPRTILRVALAFNMKQVTAERLASMLSWRLSIIAVEIWPKILRLDFQSMHTRTMLSVCAALCIIVN